MAAGKDCTSFITCVLQFRPRLSATHCQEIWCQKTGFLFLYRLAYPQVVKTTQKRMEDKRDNICEKASHFFAHRRDVWVHVLGLFLSKLRGYLSNAWFGTFPGVSLKSVNVGSLSWLYIAITGNIV